MTRIGIVAVLAAVALSGCMDRAVDVGPIGALNGAPSPADEGGPIRRITGEKTTYPNLSTVPPRPTDVPTEAARQADLDALTKARAANRSAAGKVQNDPRLKDVTPIPPKPDMGR